MLNDLIQTLIAWIGQHPNTAGAMVCLVAAAESFAIIGLFVPGALMMFAAGALIAAGALSFWPIAAWAVVGAIIGDGASFWLGRRYGQGVTERWPLRGRAEWVERGQRFVDRHGAKSVLFGRFVGPVRPVIPLVAGIMGMRPAAFFVTNVLSAVAWAPAYLLPGMAFGASLALARAVALRLSVLMALLVALTWALLHLVRWSYVHLPGYARMGLERIAAYTARHPRLDRLATPVIERGLGTPRELLILGIVLVLALWAFFGILEDVLTGDPLVRVDSGLYHLLRGLRTPWGDHLMTAVTELGDPVVTGTVALVVLAWLALLRRWRTALYWAGAVGLGVVATLVLKHVIGLPRPSLHYVGTLSSGSFPSGHATLSVVVYGFLAALSSHNVVPARRWLVYGAAALLVIAIAFSRLYLGVHWLSDVLGGIALGLSWVTLLTIAYRHGTERRTRLPGVGVAAMLALAVTAPLHIDRQYRADLARYAPQRQPQILTRAAWWGGAWRYLPAYRIDLGGEREQPLDLQWAGTPAQIQRRLEAAGWHTAAPLTATTALRWLAPTPPPEELPLLPQVHDGRHEVVRLVRRAPNGKGLLVLRLWPTDALLSGSQTPVLVGNITAERVEHILLLSVPRSETVQTSYLMLLDATVKGLSVKQVRRNHVRVEDEHETPREGTVWLIAPPAQGQRLTMTTNIRKRVTRP